MKTTCFKTLGLWVLLTCEGFSIHAQGMIYLNNLGQPLIGINPVGSDLWVASTFFTGNNAEGYLLDSIQLGIGNASGDPNGFTVMVYSAIALAGGMNPGSSLVTLNGSSNPTNAGAYVFSLASSLTLLPNTDYFVVLTANTTVASGAYDKWGLTVPPVFYSPIDSWNGGGVWESEDGSTWIYRSLAPYYAIAATAIPEPSSFALLWLAGALFVGRMLVRR